MTNCIDDVTDERRIDIAKLGVRPEDFRSLETTIRGLSDVKSSSIDGGVLTYTLKLGRLSGTKRKNVAERVHAKVLQLCEHKKMVPGKGSTRRSQKPRFNNNPQRAMART